MNASLTFSRSSLFLLLGLAAVACGGGADAGDGLSEGASPNTSNTTIKPGTLTAGAWDDNRNFDFFKSYLAGNPAPADAPPLSSDQRAAAHDAFAGDRAAVSSLDVAFVVDNTGSMGDEIEYLKVEFDAIVASVAKAHPGVDVRWATVAYRDDGDDYVTRVEDFSSDPDDAADGLDDMSAGGGGDYPEGVVDALEDTLDLDWSSRGRIVFWIADAPHHPGEGEDVAELLSDAKKRGVHIYPIAASGADELTELTMRSAAQLTGGRYLFLTDDSGVGNTHKEPSVPCYFVTTLADAVTRMIDIEVSGTYVEPAAADVIRTGGDPKSGACTLADGATVVAF